MATTEDITERIFTVVCQKVRKEGPEASLTRDELEKAVGVPHGELVAAIKAIRGPANDQDLLLRFIGGDMDRITLGSSWLFRCQSGSYR